MGAANSPGAQTATAIDVSRLEDEPLFSVSDILRQSPGVSVKQGNGPRYLGISIRGSNARNGFGGAFATSSSLTTDFRSPSRMGCPAAI